MGLSQDTLSIQAILGLHRVSLYLVCIHKLETRVGEESWEEKHKRTRISPFFPRSWWFRVATCCHGGILPPCDRSVGPLLTECLCQYDQDHVVVKRVVKHVVGAKKESKGISCHRTHLKLSSSNHGDNLKWCIDLFLHHHKPITIFPCTILLETHRLGLVDHHPHHHTYINSFASHTTILHKHKSHLEVYFASYLIVVGNRVAFPFSTL